MLVYRAHAGAELVSTASINAAIAIMRKRVATLGIPSDIQRSGANEITVALPDAGNLAPGGEQVGKTAQLDFYDWEPNVIGPAGTPAPTEGTVTGGPNAGAAQFGLTEYQAVLRAAKRAAIIRSNDTTLDPGCTPAQIGGCRYGVWYLLDTKHEKVLRGPEESEHSFYEAGYTPPAGAVVTAVHVNPGTVLVQARPRENAAGKVINASPNSWYVLNDDPALTGSDLTNPQPAFEEGGKPDVTFGFTAHGKTAFEQVTKETAHRGMGNPAPRRQQGRGRAALRDRARQPDHHRAVDRLHEVPGRDRRFHRLADSRRIHDQLGPEPRERATVRSAADQPGVGVSLACAGRITSACLSSWSLSENGPTRGRIRWPHAALAHRSSAGALGYGCVDAYGGWRHVEEAQ